MSWWFFEVVSSLSQYVHHWSHCSADAVQSSSNPLCRPSRNPGEELRPCLGGPDVIAYAHVFDAAHDHGYDPTHAQSAAGRGLSVLSATRQWLRNLRGVAALLLFGRSADAIGDAVGCCTYSFIRLLDVLCRCVAIECCWCRETVRVVQLLPLRRHIDGRR